MNWKRFTLKVFMKDGDPDNKGGTGDGGKSWQELLPEGIREWDEVKNSETPEKFWEQMTNMKSFLGQSIRIPSAEAGAEDIKKFHEKLTTHVPGLMPVPDTTDENAVMGVLRKLGLPEKPEEYELPEFDEKKFNKEYAENFKKIAHKYGLTKKQFKNVIKEMYDAEAAKITAEQTIRDTEFTGLTKKWGAAFDDRMKAIIALAEKSKAPDQLLGALKNNQVAPGTLEWMYNLTQAIGGPEGLNLFEDGSGQSGGGKMTPAEAKAIISEIMNNKDHAYWVASHPQHKEAMAHMIELRKLADPQASSSIDDLRSGMRGAA